MLAGVVAGVDVDNAQLSPRSTCFAGASVLLGTPPYDAAALFAADQQGQALPWRLETCPASHWVWFRLLGQVHCLALVLVSLPHSTQCGAGCL
jgi:hypothetical protein